MCWQPDIYLTNTFLDLVAHSWQVAWPHPFSQTHEYNPTTKLLQFTPAFRRVIRDVNSYRCKAAFFDQYPESLVLSLSNPTAVVAEMRCTSRLTTAGSAVKQ